MSSNPEKTPVGLGDLSTEVLLLIFSRFCLHCSGEYDQPPGVGTYQQHHEKRIRRRVRFRPEAKPWYAPDRQALYSLCLASSKMRAIAQSILYHEFRLGYGDAGATIHPWEKRIGSFIRTTVMRPELGSVVGVVSVYPPPEQAFSLKSAKAVFLETASLWCAGFPAAWRERSTLAAAERRAWPAEYCTFISSFLDFGLNEDKTTVVGRSLMTSYKRYLVAELVAMMVSKLPNVQYFHLQDGEMWPRQAVWPLPFASLGVTSLPITTIATDAPLQAPIAAATELKTLNVHAPKREFPAGVPFLPSITSLRLTGVSMRDEPFKALLDRCTGSLETFVYEARYSDRVDRSTPLSPTLEPANGHFRPCLAVKMLAGHQRSLRVFHLDLRGQPRFSLYGDNSEFHLRDFQVLEDVLLSTNSMYTLVKDPTDDLTSLVRLLPESIVSLHLTFRNREEVSRLMGGLRGLIGVLQQPHQSPRRFPKLRLIQHDCVGFSDGGDQGLGRAFASLGVEFRFKSWPIAHFESPFH